MKAELWNRREKIAARLQTQMGISADDHFWLRIDTMRTYLGDIRGYGSETRKRLQCSTYFCNWWVMQCIQVEERMTLAIGRGDMLPTQDMYEAMMRLHGGRRHVQIESEHVAQRCLLPARVSIES